MLESRAPFRTKPADQQVWAGVFAVGSHSVVHLFQEVFVRNCLFIISYCPTLSDDIIHLLVHKMTLIDVSNDLSVYAVTCTLTVGTM